MRGPIRTYRRAACFRYPANPPLPRRFTNGISDQNSNSKTPSKLFLFQVLDVWLRGHATTDTNIRVSDHLNRGRGAFAACGCFQRMPAGQTTMTACARGAHSDLEVSGFSQCLQKPFRHFSARWAIGITKEFRFVRMAVPTGRAATNCVQAAGVITARPVASIARLTQDPTRLRRLGPASPSPVQRP
jgi:hypothetical protein